MYLEEFNYEKLKIYSFADFLVLIDHFPLLDFVSQDIFLENFFNSDLNEMEKLDILLLLSFSSKLMRIDITPILLYYEFMMTKGVHNDEFYQTLLFIIFNSFSNNQYIPADTLTLFMKDIFALLSFNYKDIVKKINNRINTLQQAHQHILSDLPPIYNNLLFTLAPLRFYFISEIKAMLFPLFMRYPILIPPFLSHFTEGIFNGKTDNTKWLKAIVEIIRNIDLVDKTKVVQILTDLTQLKKVTQTLQIEISITLWVITNDISFLQSVEILNKKLTRKIQRILKDPQKEYEKVLKTNNKRYRSAIEMIKRVKLKEKFDYSKNILYTIKSKNSPIIFEIEGINTLYDLSQMIINDFRLSPFHLYSFYMNKKAYSNYYFNCPDDEEGPYMDKIIINDLHLVQGSEFLFLHDFRRENRFNLVVKKMKTLN